jgi:hypothetical protein
MFIKRIISATLATALVLACGADQQQIIKSFAFNVANNILSFGVQFNQNIELNTELNIPILNYGSITLTPPADGKGFIIGGSINMNYINDGSIVTLNKTRLLPNGQPMTTYVTEDLAQIRIKDSDQIYSDIYLGTSMQNMYLGTALELGYIDQYFPAGLVISVRITDSKNRALGVITIFGPHLVNGELVSPGGFFFVTNITQLMQYYPNGTSTVPSPIYDMPSFRNLVEINPQYRSEYSNPIKLNDLMVQFHKAGQDAGYVDKDNHR